MNKKNQKKKRNIINLKKVKDVGGYTYLFVGNILIGKLNKKEKKSARNNSSHYPL